MVRGTGGTGGGRATAARRTALHSERPATVVIRQECTGIYFLWRNYLRRFNVDRSTKTLKARLGWTTPRVRYLGPISRLR